MSENYSIGWNTFEDHLKETSKKLYDKKYFADVTLVSEDLVQIQAHRFTLSSSSPVLEKLLLMNQDSRALIYLKGIKHEELEAVTKFIYLGETKVKKERVDDFLKASADLQIKYFHNNISSIQQQKYNIEHKDDKLVEERENIESSKPSADTKLGQHESEDGFECDVCRKVFVRKDIMERHVRTIHQSEEECLECPYTDCKKLFTRKDLLEKHESRAHKNKEKYICNSYKDCNQKFGKKDALDKHVQSHHSEEEECYSCSDSVCLKSFARKDQRELHEYKVHQEFRCEDCNIYFKGKNAHYKHLKKLHPQGLGRKKDAQHYVCANCMQAFLEKDELEKHIDSNHKLTCEICHIRVLKKNMNRHKLTHEDEEPNDDEDYILDDEF